MLSSSKLKIGFQNLEDGHECGADTRPLVSCDYVNDPRSSIIDAQSAMVVNGTQVKVLTWYDNERGYACRVNDILRMVAGAM